MLHTDDTDTKLLSSFNIFTACQVCFYTEATESTGKINMLLKDTPLSTSLCHLCYKFDCNLTLKGSFLSSKDKPGGLSQMFPSLIICQKPRDRGGEEQKHNAMGMCLLARGKARMKKKESNIEERKRKRQNQIIEKQQ